MNDILGEKFRETFRLKEPLASFLLSKMEINKSVGGPLTRMSFTPKAELVIREDWWDLPREKQAAAILQQLLHLLLGHHASRLAGNGRMQKAQSLAVNSLLNSVSYVLPEEFELPTSYDLPPLLAAEEYYEKLEDEEANSDQDGWTGPNSETAADWLSKSLSDYLLDHNHLGHSLDSIDYFREELIETYAKRPSWYLEVLGFLTHSLNRRQGYDYRRFNRRLGSPHPARKFKDKLKVAVLIDSSSSMRKNLAAAFSEVKHLTSLYEVDIYQCDTEIRSVHRGAKVDDIFKVAGFGGTNLQPAFDHLCEVGVSHLVCLTDARFETEIDVRGINTMWVVFGDAKCCLPGKVLRVE